MQNCHFYIFQEPNSFEGPPSHIQFIDMPVDSSYMDGVGIFSDMDEFCTSVVFTWTLHGCCKDETFIPEQMDSEFSFFRATI